MILVSRDCLETVYPLVLVVIQVPVYLGHLTPVGRRSVSTEVEGLDHGISSILCYL